MLREWPSRHIAKCLVSFDADDPAALKSEQIEALQDLRTACDDSGREMLLEVIPPAVTGDARDADRSAGARGHRNGSGGRPARLVEVAGTRRARTHGSDLTPQFATPTRIAAACLCSAWTRRSTSWPISLPKQRRIHCVAASRWAAPYSVKPRARGLLARSTTATAIEAISQRYLRLVRRFADARHAVRPQAVTQRSLQSTVKDIGLRKTWSASDSSASA